MAAHSSSQQPTKELSPEAQEQQELQEYLSQETPEISMGSFILQMAGAIGIAYVAKRGHVNDAFKLLNDEKFARNLLRLKDPKQIEKYLAAQKTVQAEMERQKKRRGKDWKPDDTVKVGRGRWKQTTTIDTLERKFQALGLAHGVHNHINNQETLVKIANAASIYGIDGQKLVGGFEEWKKKNKGRGLDEYLAIEPRKLFLEKQKAEGGPTGRQTDKPLKDADKALIKANASARTQAAYENLPVLRAAQRGIHDTLDPSQTKLTQDQLKDRVTQVLQGDYGKPSITPTTTTTTVTPSQSVPFQGSPPRGRPSAPPAGTPSGFRQRMFAPINNFMQALQSRLTAIQSAIAAQIAAIRNFVNRFNPANIASRLANRAKNALSSKAKDIINKIPGLKGLGALLSLLGGKWKDAVDALKSAAISAALVAAGPILIILGIVVGIGIIIPLLMNNPLMLFSSGLDQALIVSVDGKPQTLGWNQFEKTYLSYKEKEDGRILTWKQLEEGFLTINDHLMTLYDQ